MQVITKFFTTGVLFASMGGAAVLLGTAIPSSSASPFTFDAPSRSATVLAVQKETALTGTARVVNAAGEVVLLDDWTYTGLTGHISPAK